MNHNKVSKQQLKSPDLIQLKMYSLIDWIAKNQRSLIITGAVGVLLGASIVSWNYYQNSKLLERQELLAGVDKIYLQEEEEAEKVRTGFTDQVTALSARIEKEASEEKKKELTAQKKTLEEQLSKQIVPHLESRERYLAFAEGYMTTPEGWRAGVNAAQIDIAAKKHLEAKEILARVLKSSLNSEFYQEFIRDYYINVLEELKDYPAALEEAETLIKLADDANLPKALLRKGQLLLATEDVQAAREVFDKIVVEHNSSYEAQRAQVILTAWRSNS